MINQRWVAFQEGGRDPWNFFFKQAKSNKKNIDDSLMMIIIIKVVKEIKFCGPQKISLCCPSLCQIIPGFFVALALSHNFFTKAMLNNLRILYVFEFINLSVCMHINPIIHDLCKSFVISANHWLNHNYAYRLC